VLLVILAESIPAENWIEPFNNKEHLRILCTDNNHFDVMRGRESPVVKLICVSHIHF
jgi:hypothetical protein